MLNIFSKKNQVIITLPFLLSINTYADTVNVTKEYVPNDITPDTIKLETDIKQKNNKIVVLPTEKQAKKLDFANMSQTEKIAYLKQHPKEFEDLLSIFLYTGNPVELKVLLPPYKQVKNHDPSVIDWGNAIIALHAGEFKKSIALYRKINAALPNIKRVRLQMAIALFQDGQYEAAQNQFEKLKSDKISTDEKMLIDGFLTAIQKKQSWSYSGGVSYVSDNNITNAPPVGTKIGDKWTFTNERQSGKGISYYVSADKKWLADDKFFTAVEIGSNGKFYVNNKNFNDISISTAFGLGYQDLIREIEFGPTYSQRWYGGGTSGTGSLKRNSDTVGMRFKLKHWLSPKWQYRNFSQTSFSNYVEEYESNNSRSNVISNTLLYFANQNTYLYGAYTYLNKDASNDVDTYTNNSLRFGWGQSWPLGLSTLTNVGAGRKKYDNVNLFGIKEENTQYNVGASIWHRGLHFYGITPRLNFSYEKVVGNNPFNEYQKNDVDLSFSKTF